MQETDREKLLATLYDAERSVRKTHDELVQDDRAALVLTLAKHVADAKKQKDHDGGLRLVRIAELLAEIDSPASASDKALDLLIDVLGAEDGEARLTAGEALEERASYRFKEVAMAVERATARLSSDDPALLELPFVLTEVPEPQAVLKLLSKFLTSQNPEVIASAIEALAEVGEADASRMLRPLETDKRTVEIEGDGDGAKVTIGELAREARELLERFARDAKGARKE